MRFEKFEAPDMRTALTNIKASLGPDAVIIATREVRRAGLFRRAVIEVTAGLEDPAPLQTSAPAASEPVQAISYGQEPAERLARGRAQQTTQEARERAEAFTPPLEAPLTPPSKAKKLRAKKRRALAQELAPLQQEIRSLRALLRDREKSSDTTLTSEIEQMRDMLSSLTLREPHFSGRDLYVSILEAADVAPDLLKKVVGEARHAAEAEVVREPAEAVVQQVQALKEAIAHQLTVLPHFFEQAGPRRIALIGPTGVGKTTTVAKLAAHAALRYGQRVALISLDTYRIGASEQIREYARLIDVPLVIAHEREGFTRAMRRFHDYDLVLIDTAGRSPSHLEVYREELGTIFADHQIQIFLTIAASTRWAELSSLLGELPTQEGHALIVTKLDEAVALGSCLNASYHAGLPLAFVTTGQRVPEDLATASDQDLAAKLVEQVLDSTRQAFRVGSRRKKTEAGAMREQVA